LPFGGEKGFFLLAGAVQACGEGVFLARYPAFARIVDLGYKARGRDYVTGFIQFDKGVPVEETFDMEGGKSDEIGFFERGEFEQGMANLFDVDCT
jgi:hypothetical protein